MCAAVGCNNYVGTTTRLSFFRLTERHITLPAFSSMKVSLAAQVLSHSVAAGITTLCMISDKLDSEAIHTAGRGGGVGGGGGLPKYCIGGLHNLPCHPQAKNRPSFHVQGEGCLQHFQRNVVDWEFVFVYFIVLFVFIVYGGCFMMRNAVMRVRSGNYRPARDFFFCEHTCCAG